MALLAGSFLVHGAMSPAAAYSSRTANRSVGIEFAGGDGHRGKVWAGTWNNGERGFCIDFGSTTPNNSGTKTLNGPDNIPGMTTEETKQAKFVANKYSRTSSNEDAANANLAIWRYRADSAFNTWYNFARSKNVINPARHLEVNAIMADAAQHGLYKVDIQIDSLEVGQTGFGRVTVRGSNNKPAAGRLISLSPTEFAGNGAKILKVNRGAGTQGITRPDGVLVFEYQSTKPGRVGVRAWLTAPSSSQARLSITTSGHQRTLGGDFKEFAKDYDDYTKYSDLKIGESCDTNCGGNSQVTFEADNTKGKQNIRWSVRKSVTKSGESPTAATFFVAPGLKGGQKVSLPDGSRITESWYCYTGSVLGGPCTSTLVKKATAHEVICPAWAQATLKAPCNCTPGEPGSVTMSSPAGSPRFYRGFVSVNKGPATALNLESGQPVTFPIGQMGAGTTNVVISFTVYKDAARTQPIVVKAPAGESTQPVLTEFSLTF